MVDTHEAVMTLPEQTPTAQPQRQPAPSYITPTHAVLVVDDQEYVRDMLRRCLEKQGFEVWLAASGWEALEIYQHHWDEFAAVLLDVRMPGLDGPQTLRCMYHINPRVRACFMSGGTGAYVETQLLNEGAVRVFWKPFHLDEVVSVLRQIASNSLATARPA
jgi:CheY-like chemotaxis protein